MGKGFFYLILTILLTTTVNAMEIHINEEGGSVGGLVLTDYWDEVIHLEENGDLNISLGMHFIWHENRIKEYQAELPSVLEINFVPYRANNSYALNWNEKNSIACIGSTQILNDYAGVELNCANEGNLHINVTKNEGDRLEHFYRINLSNVTINDSFSFRLNYILPNFINQKSTHKFLMLKTVRCSPGWNWGVNFKDTCPNNYNRYTYLILPDTVSLDDYPLGEVELKSLDYGSLMLYYWDFTPKNKNEQYATIFVQYTDNKEEFWEQWRWIFFAIIVGFCIERGIEKINVKYRLWQKFKTYLFSFKF